jgi:hypothetical protein
VECRPRPNISGPPVNCGYFDETSFLHFRKKLFVAKGEGCDLSTVQVVVHTYRLHFCLVPHRPSILLTMLKFATADSSGLPLVDPICSSRAQVFFFMARASPYNGHSYVA